MTTQNFWKERVREGALLNPVDRISEVLFGLIMVLTFTGAISVATDGKQEIRELLWAALGCNVAWGFVDAIMYTMNVIIERGHASTVIQHLMKSSDKQKTRAILRDEIQPMVSALLSEEELDRLADKVKQLPAPKKTDLLTMKDLVSGFQIFMLVFVCTLPVALPFAIFKEVAFAMRFSNGVALIMLFIGGVLLAHYAGFRWLLTAIIYTVIGMSMVLLTMALGG